MLKTVPEHTEPSSAHPVWFVVSAGVILLLLLVGTCTPSEDCKIESVSGIAFPQYNPFLSSPASATGSFIVRCGVSAQGKVSLSAGGSGNFSRRWMGGTAGDVLFYNLYENASCTTIWGDGEQGTRAGSFAFGPGGGSKQFFVYGIMPARQNVGAQSFREELTITVEW